jgi:hypothetical protein
MLVHRGCHGQVYLNLGPAYKFIAGFGIDRKGLTTNICEIIQIGNTGPSLFFCPDCQTDVPLEEVVIQCMQGGEFVEVSDAVRSESAGGMYCREHGVEYFDDCKPLNIRTFTIKKSSVSR